MNTIKLIEELTEKFDLLGTAAFKNSTSVVTSSSDLVESGAVKDIVGWGNKNINGTKYENTITNGIIFTVQSDGSIIANGTATSDAVLALGTDKGFIAKETGQYIYSGLNSGVAGIHLFVFDDTDNARPYTDSSMTTRLNSNNGNIYNGNEISFYMIAGHSYRMVFRVSNGTVANNVHAYPMIRKASVTDASYEPYHASVSEMFESLGGTLDCNQLIQNGNFVSTSGWSTYRSTLSVSNNIAQLVYGEPGNDYVLIRNLNCKANHKYLVMSDVKPIANARMNYYLLKNDYSYSEASRTKNISSGVWNRCEAIILISQDTNVLWLSIQLDSSNTSTEVKNYNLIDLTALFGSAIADKIYAMEQATAGSGVAYFRKYFPNDYYEYSADDGILAEKADNSTIAPVENGSTASQAYAVGTHAIRNGAFITWKNAKAQGEPINDADDYTSGDVADSLQAIDVTSEFTFANDITFATTSGWTKIYKVGNIIKGYLRFTTPSTVSIDKVVVTIPTKYLPRTSGMYFSTLVEAWTGVTCGLLANGANAITLISDTWEPSKSVVANFEYVI